MSAPENLAFAQRLLDGLGSGADANTLAMLFSADVRFEVPGDDGELPWIGLKIGREAAAAFITGTHTLVEPQHFAVRSVTADDEHAVVIGEFWSRLKANGRSVESPFAMILTVGQGRITQFQFLEDSYAVSRAARASKID